MAPDIDRRTYDLLRLINTHEPIGSIRLVTLMQRRGYSIKDRTIRLHLSELDEEGLTEKLVGKGRQLTEDGRAELRRGDVDSRLEHVREYIATLTSQVTYDPTEDTGELVVGTGCIAAADIDSAFDLLEQLHHSTVGPVLVATEEVDDGIEFAVPSSITLDGVLLTRGINTRLVTAGLIEYDDNVRRYTDVISGKEATMDVVSLLIEAGRTDVTSYLERGTGILIVDNREFPLTRFEETSTLSGTIQEQIGGVLDLRRPRESGPVPAGTPGWDFASLTYGGSGEAVLALLREHGLLEEWDSLGGLRARAAFEPVPTVVSRW